MNEHTPTPIVDAAQHRFLEWIDNDCAQSPAPPHGWETARALETDLATALRERDEARDSHRKQAENYIRLCDAVMGDGARTSDFHDPVEIAKATRTELAEARKDSERLDWLTGWFDKHGEVEISVNRHDGRRFTRNGATLLVFESRCGTDETLRAAIDAAKEQP